MADLDGYLSELVTTAQNCGAWPEMRELQFQCEDAFRDTLLRLVRETRQRAIIPYRTERARDKATMDRMLGEGIDFQTKYEELEGRHGRATDAMQADVRELLIACGLGDHARPVSCHQIIHDEILPRIREMSDQCAWVPGDAS